MNNNIIRAETRFLAKRTKQVVATMVKNLEFIEVAIDILPPQKYVQYDFLIGKNQLVRVDRTGGVEVLATGGFESGRKLEEVANFLEEELDRFLGMLLNPEGEE